jgi:hypothetical protein
MMRPDRVIVGIPAYGPSIQTADQSVNPVVEAIVAAGFVTDGAIKYAAAVALGVAIEVSASSVTAPPAAAAGPV